MIKAIYEKKEDIPEGFSELYTEKAGKFELTGVEGFKTQADVDRLQESLRKERADHDATKASLRETKDSMGSLTDELDAFKKGSAPTQNQEPTHEDLVLLSQLKRENESLLAERDEFKGKFTNLEGEVTASKIKDLLRIEAIKHMKPEAVDHEVAHAVKDFTLLEGRALTNPELGDKGGIEPGAYFADVVKSRAYLAIPSNSGGATGGQGTASPSAGDAPSSRAEIYNDLFAKNS
jgi:hypothetical protein